MQRLRFFPKQEPTEHVCIFSHFSCVRLFVTPWTAARLLCPWDSPSKNNGVGSHSLLQGTFPTQGSNPGLLHCRQILCHVNHQGRFPPPQNILIAQQTFCHLVVRTKLIFPGLFFFSLDYDCGLVACEHVIADQKLETWSMKEVLAIFPFIYSIFSRVKPPL